MTGLVLVGVVVAVGVLLARGGEGGVEPVAAEPVATTEVGESAPASSGEEPVRLKGVDPLTGDLVRLSDFDGKPVVVNFWASWCPPCRDELPALVELERRHPELVVLGVNEQDQAEAARAFQRELGWTFPSIADPNGSIARRLGLVGMPTTFFLDARHTIAAKATGALTLEGFENGVEVAQRSRS